MWAASYFQWFSKKERLLNFKISVLPCSNLPPHYLVLVQWVGPVKGIFMKIKRRFTYLKVVLPLLDLSWRGSWLSSRPRRWNQTLTEQICSRRSIFLNILKIIISNFVFLHALLHILNILALFSLPLRISILYIFLQRSSKTISNLMSPPISCNFIGKILSGTCRQRDASSKGMHHPRDALSKGSKS